MVENKKLSSNMEDYLEAIIVLKKKNGVARVRDISKLLNVKTSSVTSALNSLAKNGFVLHERYGYVELTKGGEELAYNVQRRHNFHLRSNRLIRSIPSLVKIDFLTRK